MLFNVLILTDDNEHISIMELEVNPVADVLAAIKEIEQAWSACVDETKSTDPEEWNVNGVIRLMEERGCKLNVPKRETVVLFY